MTKLLIIMSSIAFSMRIFPFVFSKWLKNIKHLNKLGAMLPLCITVLLVAHMLEDVSFTSFPFAIPEWTGLGFVVIAHIFFRNILLSMGIGICTHQLLLHFTSL